MSPSDRIPATAKCTALIVALFIGAFLRLYHLGTASLWIDEITFVSDAQPHLSFRDTWRRLVGSYGWFHRSPLPVALAMAFAKAASKAGFPLEEATWRFPFAVMGVACLPVMFLLGRRLFDERVGLISAFLLSVSFFHAYYSREAYMYSPYFLAGLLSWYFLATVLTDLWNGRRPTPWGLAGYGVTTALTLQMHMTAVFFVFAQFLLLVASPWIGSFRELPRQEQSRRLLPVVGAHGLAWASFAPFLWIILTRYLSTDEQVEQRTGLVPFLRMLGEMGWGSRWQPLIIFLGMGTAGLAWALRERSSRQGAILCLVLGGISSVGVGYFAQRARFETRYFLMLLPTLLLLVAVAWARLGERLVAGRPRTLRLLGWLAPCVGLLVWHGPFYQQLFQLRAKLFNGRDVAEWINRNTPPDAGYLLDTPYTLREVPGYYATPARHAGGPPVHLLEGKEQLDQLRSFLESVFRRFPDLYFVDTTHSVAGSPEQTEAWARRWFRQQARIENPEVGRLIRLGIFPSSAFWDSRADQFATFIYYNTTEDLLQRARQQGEAYVIWFGPEWVFCETPTADGALHHWKGLHHTGRIWLYVLDRNVLRARVSLRGASCWAAQTIAVEVAGISRQFTLPPDRPGWLDLGEITLQPGRNEILVRKNQPQPRYELANFLVSEVRMWRQQTIPAGGDSPVAPPEE